MRVKTLTLPMTVAETDIDDWARTVLSLQTKGRRDRMQDVGRLAASRILNRKEAK